MVHRDQKTQYIICDSDVSLSVLNLFHICFKYDGSLKNHFMAAIPQKPLSLQEINNNHYE